MIVKESLTTHRKMSKLLKLSGNDPWCLWWLVELWGYCYATHSERLENMTADRLGDICRWGDTPGAKILSFLLESGFVKWDGKTLVVHKWELRNQYLFSAQKASQKSAEIRAARAGKPFTSSGERAASVRSAGGERGATGSKPHGELMNERKKERTREARAKNALEGVFAENKKTAGGGIVNGKLQPIVSSATLQLRESGNAPFSLPDEDHPDRWKLRDKVHGMTAALAEQLKPPTIPN